VRLSDRLMARLGWEPLAPRRWHRNFIRRFYGVYPSSDDCVPLFATEQAGRIEHCTACLPRYGICE
jgi:hypothetical protein